MDSKLGLDYEVQLKSNRLSQEYQRNQEQSPILNIFSQMGHPPIETPMPSLFPELHLSITSLSSQLKQQSFD